MPGYIYPGGRCRDFLYLQMRKGVLIDNVVKTDNQVLFVEEALYLLEKRKLLILEDGLPCSSENLFSHSRIHSHVYRVYSFLRQKGYILKRASFDRGLYESRRWKTSDSLDGIVHHYDVYRNSQSAKLENLSFRLLIIPTEDSEFDFGWIPNIKKLKIAFVSGPNIQFSSALVDP
jgi:hypothetical protein